MVTEFPYVFELHDLEERILDDGERNARGNIGNFRTFLLRLLDLRVHEDGATRAEVNGRLRINGFGRKLCRRHVQSLGKILDKGTTAGGTRFIERDIANAAILDEEALHILSADIEYECDLRAEFLCRPQMREGLDLAAVSMQSRLDNGLAISRRHRAGNMRAFRQSLIEFLDFLYHRLERRTMIAAIRGIEDFLILADSRNLRRRRTCIDTDINRSLVRRQITAFHLVLVMTCLETRIILTILKQSEIGFARLLGRSFPGPLDTLFKDGQVDDLRLIGKRCAHGHEIVAVIDIDNMFVVQFKRLDETFLEFWQEMKRPAKKSDFAIDRTPLRQIADGLIDHGLEDGKSNIGFLGTIIHECLDIRLGKYATARSDCIDLLAFGSQVVEPLASVESKDACVNERSRTTGTDSIHALLWGIAEVGNLSIFTTEFHHGIRLWYQLPYRSRTGDDLLDEGQADALRNAHTGRPGQSK